MLARLQTILSRLLPPVYVAALLDPANIRDNPIAEREARKERRGKDLWLMLFATGATLVGLFALYAWVIDLMARTRFLHGGMPRYFGGSFGASLFIVVSGMHAWFVLQASQRKTGSFFLDEYRRNTLHGLLTISSTPFQTVIQAAIHPFRQSMLVALMGLPFYLYSMSIGGISWSDLLGLYLLFALLSFRPPRWRIPVFAGLKPDEIAKKNKQAGQGGPLAWTITMLWVLGIFGRILNPVFGRNWLGELVTPAWQLLPPHAQSIGVSFVLAWPLILVRWMMTAEPFFGLKLPPVLIVPVLTIGNRLIGAWLSGMYLRIEEGAQLGRLWDSGEFRRVRFFFESFILFVAFGFLWKPYVGAGLTASLVKTTPGPPDDALVGLLWLLGGFGALVTWSRCWWIRSQESQGRRAGSLLWAATPFLAMTGVYTAGCLLAGRNPFPLPVLEMAGKLVAITAGGAIISRCSASALLTPLTLGLLPLVGIVSKSTAMITIVSPFAGLLSLSDHVGRITNSLLGYTFVPPPWWLYAIVPALLGFLLRGKVRHRELESSPRIAPLVLPPDQPAKLKYSTRKDTPVALRTIEWLQSRWDNAVMVKELRVKLRGHLGRGELSSYLVLFALPTALCYYYQDILPAAVEWLRSDLFGTSRQTPDVVGASISIISLFSAILMPFVGAFTAATAFARERDRSTLVFLLMTPMPTIRIVLGKLIGLLLPVVMYLLAASAWMGLLAVVEAVEVGPAQAAIGWMLASLTPFVLMAGGAALGLVAASLLRREADATGISMLFLFLSAWLFGFFLAGVSEIFPALQSPNMIAPGALLCGTIFTAILLSGSVALACWRVGRWRITEGEKAG